MNNEVCIYSPHEKGFWQADVYLEGWQEGLCPDWFCTGKVGGTKSEIIAQVKQHYPDVKFLEGITGFCNDCSTEFFNLEKHCDECGGILSE